MPEYVTTNIRLPKAMHERLRRLALEENKSFAEIVRESLVEYLSTTGTLDRLTAHVIEDDPLYRITELTRPEDVIGGDRPIDTSARHDDYLYGADQDQSSSSDVDEPQ